MSATGKAPQHWFAAALHSTVAGVLFAGCLATGLVLLQAASFRPVLVLEQAGIDLGMRLYGKFDFLATQAPATSQSYAFVDVDRDACAAFLDGDAASACASRNPARSSLLVDLLRALRASGAKVVIVDVVPPDAANVRERAAWRSAMVADDGPWVIAPLAARPADDCGDGLSIHGDRAADIIPSHAQGRLRLASVATILDAKLNDGVVRHYPAAARLLLEGEPARWVPSAPLLAAQLAMDDLAAQADRRYFGAQPTAPVATATATSAPTHTGNPAANVCGRVASTGSASQVVSQVAPPIASHVEATSAALIPARQLFDPWNLDVQPPLLKFFYSLPALSTLQGGELQRAEARLTPLYERYEASRLIDFVNCRHRLDAQSEEHPGCFAQRPDLFAGKIVLVGASSATALDRIATPVGAMSGAEVLLNATRAFGEFPEPHAPGFLSMWLSKMLGLLLLAPIALLSWMAIHALSARVARAELQHAAPASRRWRSAGLRAGATLAIVAIFVGGTLLAVAIDLKMLIADLSHASANPEPVDMLVPVVAMGLEGYATAAAIIEGWLHRPTAAIVGGLHYLLDLIRGRLRK